jgi:hypothetical protein
MTKKYPDRVPLNSLKIKELRIFFGISKFLNWLAGISCHLTIDVPLFTLFISPKYRGYRIKSMFFLPMLFVKLSTISHHPLMQLIHQLVLVIGFLPPQQSTSVSTLRLSNSNTPFYSSPSSKALLLKEDLVQLVLILAVRLLPQSLMPSLTQSQK